MIHLQNDFIISLFIILCLNLVLVFFMIKFNYVILRKMYEETGFVIWNFKIRYYF